MAVNINTVYQKVLAIANKEKRGYITPQEFNLFADQAQKEIFEQYFYDLNQFKRIPGNTSNYADMVDYLEDKISLFTDFETSITPVNDRGLIDLADEITDLYRLNRVTVKYLENDKPVVAEQITLKETNIYNTALSTYSKKRPVYRRSGTVGTIMTPTGPHTLKGQNIVVLPIPNIDPLIDSVRVVYTRFPKKPNWAYKIINQKPFYDGPNSTNFELHPSDESELVYRILFMAGVAIEKPQLSQFAAQSQSAAVQQEKQ